MENNEENDWYHGVLSGAMKYIDDEQEKSTSSFTGYSTEWESFKRETKPDQFSHLIHTVPGSALRKAFLKKGFSEGMKGWVNVEIITTKDGYLIASIKENDRPVHVPVSDEEIDDKITSQLSAVVEESVVEFRELRSNFQSSIEQQHQEFQKRILELSANNSGGAQ